MENIYDFSFKRCWFSLQEKEVEEDEEDDTFDMNIKVTDPEKIGVFSQHFFCLEFFSQHYQQLWFVKYVLHFLPKNFELQQFSSYWVH